MSISPAAAVTSLAAQLERSQWASAAEIVSSQWRHLERVVQHHARHTPAFRDRLVRGGLTAGEAARPEQFHRLPVLTRRDLQGSPDQVYALAVPSGHGQVTETHTSGSTGVPAAVKRTSVTGIFWNAMAMREMRWHRRDLAGRLCAIRGNTFEVTERPSWGPPVSLFGKTGPMLVLPITHDVAALAGWVASFRPTVLLTYPTTLRALAVYAQTQGLRFPGLRSLMTTGETLTDETRCLAEETFGAPVADSYTAEELGYIAMQCPDSGRYHTAAESLLVEVLDADGRPCGPGETGRVVVTDLHNYATPLVRYANGDYAEVGAACDCGRGLPTWNRVAGRERHFVVRPDGTRHWPVFGFAACRRIAPIVQYQFVQREAGSIEGRLVVERPLTVEEEERLRAHVVSRMGYAFDVRFSYVAGSIPSRGRGKHEDFISELPVGDGAVACGSL